jgi:alanine dehydrogenase
MHVLSEDEVNNFLDRATALEAMERVFRAMASQDTLTFPLLRDTLKGAEAIVGVKAGCNYQTAELGLKAGGYWKGNAARGLDRHQSTVLLIDFHTGRPVAVVAGNNLTALRTAAASAVSVRYLARPDSAVIALLGTGRQAGFQLRAIHEVRPLRAVRAWSPDQSHVAAFAETVRALGLDFLPAASPGEAVREADIVVTVTPSTVPLLHEQDILAGTHICAMGSDTAGKQELGVDLLEKSRLFVDDVAQARSVGEAQHLVASNSVAGGRLRTLGEVLVGTAPGRVSRDDITVFDGTGVALQDLAAAHAALSRALAAGSARRIAI